MSFQELKFLRKADVELNIVGIDLIEYEIAHKFFPLIKSIECAQQVLFLGFEGLFKNLLLLV